MLIYIYDFMVWKLKSLTLVESMEEWCDLLDVPSVWQETVKKNELKLGTVDSRVPCIWRFQVMRSWQVAHKSEDTHNFCIHVTLFWQINFLSFIFLPLGQMIRLHFSCHPPVQRQSVNGTLLLFTSWLQWSLSLQCIVLWVERYCWLREWFHSCFKCSLVLW